MFPDPLRSEMTASPLQDLSNTISRIDAWLETMRTEKGYGGAVAHRWQDSLLYAEKLILNSPKKNHPALQDTLGWIYYNLGNYDLALIHIQTAIQKAPNIPTFHYHAGMTFYKKELPDKAKYHFNTANRLGNFPEKDLTHKMLDFLNSRKDENHHSSMYILPTMRQAT